MPRSKRDFQNPAQDEILVAGLFLCSATIISTLLKHLDALDNHFSTLGPCRIPFGTLIPELSLGPSIIVNPGFAIDAVLEPSVGTSDGEI